MNSYQGIALHVQKWRWGENRDILYRKTYWIYEQEGYKIRGNALMHMQGLALGLVELHEVCTDPPLKVAIAPLRGIHSPQQVHCTWCHQQTF